MEYKKQNRGTVQPNTGCFTNTKYASKTQTKHQTHNCIFIEEEKYEEEEKTGQTKLNNVAVIQHLGEGINRETGRQNITRNLEQKRQKT